METVDEGHDDDIVNSQKRLVKQKDRTTDIATLKLVKRLGIKLGCGQQTTPDFPSSFSVFIGRPRPSDIITHLHPNVTPETLRFAVCMTPGAI